MSFSVLCYASIFSPTTYHFLSSLYLSTSFLSVNSRDSEFSKTAFAFTLRGALHLTAGAEAGLHAPAEGEGKTGVRESQL